MVNALYITALFNASVKTKDDGMFGQGCLLEGLQSRELYILHTSRAKIRGPHDHCFLCFVTLAQPFSPDRNPRSTTDLRSTLLAIQFPTFKFISSHISISPSPIRFHKASIFSTVHLSTKMPAFNSYYCLTAMKKIIGNTLIPSWKMMQTSSIRNAHGEENTNLLDTNKM